MRCFMQIKSRLGCYSFWLTRVTCLFGIIGGLATIALAQVNDSEQTRASREKEEAQRIWDQAITAKGGRDRLYAIRNMVEYSTGDFRPLEIRLRSDGLTSRQKSDDVKARYVTFYVFPKKTWMWRDDRPSKLGLTVS